MTDVLGTIWKAVIKKNSLSLNLVVDSYACSGSIDYMHCFFNPLLDFLFWCVCVCTPELEPECSACDGQKTISSVSLGVDSHLPPYLSQGPSCSPLYLPSPVGVLDLPTGRCSTGPGFCVGIWTQIFRSLWQVFYLSNLLVPRFPLGRCCTLLDVVS